MTLSSHYTRPADGWWSVAPGGWFVVVMAAVGSLVFIVSWFVLGWLLQHGFYGNLVISDVGIYQQYADAMRAGQLPYRDFPLNYPPTAVPVFLVPALLAGTGDAATYGARYAANFELLMLLCGVLASVFVVIAAWQVGVSRIRLSVVAAFIGVSPLLIGPVILSRFDLWPAALTAGALAAVAAGRPRIGAIVLAVAVMAKVYPWVIAPLLLIYAWRKRGGSEAFVCAALGLGTGSLTLLPFLAGASGVVAALTDAAQRPLQVETLGASLLIVLHWLANLPVEVVSNFGSQNIAGSAAEAILVVQLALLLGALVVIWLRYARGLDEGAVGREEEGFLLAAAAAVFAYVALGKVLSPQYMVWLIPMAPLVVGRRGVVGMGATALALLMTVDYFPRRYFEYVRLEDAGPAFVVFLRNVVLVVLTAALTVPLEWARARARRAWAAIEGMVPISSVARDPSRVLLALLVVAFLLRALWLSLPEGSLIFDEAYYVNAARVMVGIHPPADQHYADQPLFLDPNSEHPPLAKAVIGLGIVFFGDNGVGWRIPSLVAGMVALLAVYGIVRALGGRPWLGVLAVGLYSFDILSFIHGRIATLDMLSLAPLLVGFWLALRERWVLAGAALAVGTLAKETGAYAVLAVLAWQGLALWPLVRSGYPIGWRELRPTALLLASGAIVGLVGLWLLDLRFTTYSTPFEHIAHILTYGLALQPTFNPQSITSAPWQWLVNEVQFSYLKTAVNTLVNGEVTGSRTIIDFRALMNPALVGALWLVVPFAAWKAWTRGSALAAWSLVWMGANYLPYVLLSLLSNRITYFYYVLPTIPGLAIATALFVAAPRVPRLAKWAYVAATVALFFAYLPFRAVP